MNKIEMKNMIAWLVSDDTGLSSLHLCGHMIGVKVREVNPYDASDRGRCIRLLKIVPKWLERIDEMKQYHGWEEQIPLIKKEFKNN